MSDAVRDNDAVKSRNEIIKSLQNEQSKEHIVFDAQGRMVFLFQAPISAKDGTPCLATEYVYKDPTSTLVVSRQDRVYSWKASWDAGFSFDPNADYDPDGDGDL